MENLKYILTKYERILRVEKVEYTVDIPLNIKNKRAYAAEQLLNSNYVDYKVVDIPFSELLEERTHGLRRVKSKE